MKLALLSDVHANLHALEACLAHARAEGAERLAFLGDLVGYGAEPAGVIERVMALVEEERALVLRGNHDELAVRPPVVAATLGDATSQWTHQQLGARHLGFLATLPLSIRMERMLLVHASADAPELWRYVYDTQAAARSLEAACEASDVRYVFGGHVHHQSLYYRGAGGELQRFVPAPGISVPVPSYRQWLATIGSVGQPRDGSPRAMYALFDEAQGDIVFHRVAYDHEAAADAIRRAGLPEFFAERLELGR